jgi:integrase
MSLLKHTYKLKDGTTKEASHWYFRFSYNGKIHFGSTGTANKKMAQDIEDKKRKELVNKHELGITESVTLKQAIKNYLDAVSHSTEILNLTTHTNKLLGFKKDNRCTAIETKYIKIFGFDGDRKFESLSTSDVQRLVTHRIKEGNKNGTILNELSTFSQMIQLNKRLDHPIPKIDFAGIKKGNQIKPAKGKLRYLSKDEETALFEQLDPKNIINGVAGDDVEVTIQQRQDIYDFVVILLATGARHTEIAKIQWSSIDLKARTIGIYRPKVDNESMLTLTARAYEVLSRRYKSKEGKHVFTSKDGGPRKYSARAFNSACHRAGIEGISFHKLRHTTASRWVQNGVSLAEVQQLLGHAKIETTMIYAHLVPNQGSKHAALVLNAIDNQ